MDFEFSEEHKLFREAIKDFVAREVLPLVDAAEKAEECPVDLFRRMGKLGYLCPGYPAEYGGGGLGEIGTCIMIEEMAKACSGITSALTSQCGLSTFTIFELGSEEQKRKFLVPAIKGEKIAAFGLTEPDAGSDASGIKTTARKEGGHYVVNGSKLYITNGPICDFVTLAVSTDRSRGTQGISVLILEKGTPGFRAAKLRKLGNHSASTGEMFFEDCRVPVENLIGEEGKGYRYVLKTINTGRITHSARSVGVAQAALEASLKYAKERHQFGQPIGKFQAIAFKLSHMATQIEAARSLLYRVAWLYDAGRDCRKEASMTKAFSADVAVRAAEEAMRIHAGAGYMAESPVQRLYRDAIVFGITEGTTEIQNMVIARELGL